MNRIAIASALIAVAAVSPYGCGALAAGAEAGRRPGAAAPSWPEIAREAKPWAYNWWMGSAVDAEGIEAQCKAMKEAGMGGFHVIPIYGAKGYEDRYRKYLSPAWMDAFKIAVETAKRYGLGVDMTMGSGWCFGGSQISPGQGSWKVEALPGGVPPYSTTGICEATCVQKKQNQ